MPMNWNRREFIKAGAVLGTAMSLPAPLHAVGPLKLTPVEFKEQLRGPIVSIPTPFTADYRLDVAGLRRMIQMGLQHKITIFELTAGDSQYFFLSDEEIRQLTKLVVDTVGSHGMTIIGTNAWWTEPAVEFARYAESVGATALQVLKPSGSEDGIVEHYRKIADSTRLPIVLHGDFPMPMLERLAKIDSIVALKEDISLSYYVDGIIRFGKRINCFSGGGLDWFLVGQPYGANAYFDSYATFAPEISVRFWEAVQRNDLKTQTEIVANYDHPFIKNFSASFWHATLEHFGVAQRYLRPPQQSYSDTEMAKVKEFYDKLGVYPKQSQG
jgi:dihydrodipicolinate synthase/N-acetylneuraminate lyase